MNPYYAFKSFLFIRETIWAIRMERLIRKDLSQWPKFTIWNAGKQGRKFYHSLPPHLQERVVAMCDVSLKKIGQSYRPHYPGNPRKSQTSRPIPIISYQNAVPPIVICVKMVSHCQPSAIYIWFCFVLTNGELFFLGPHSR